jgi:hypothetical protein
MLNGEQLDMGQISMGYRKKWEKTFFVKKLRVKRRVYFLWKR